MENAFDPLLVSERRVRSGPKRAATQDVGGGPVHRPLSFTSHFLGSLYGAPFVFCASSRGVSRFTSLCRRPIRGVGEFSLSGRPSVLFRRWSCFMADFIASSSSSCFRRPCNLWSRSRIALYASLKSLKNLFLSVSSTASRQSPAHRSICQVYMTPLLSCSCVRSA
jgi:hypothetical protein